MGYAIAEAARDQGATVTLVAAPTSLPDPAGVATVHVQTAQQMKEAVEKAVKSVLQKGFATADIAFEGCKVVGTRQMTQNVIENL